MLTNFKFGLLAEYLVMLIYRARFYSVLAHRNRNHAGEVDIICQRGRLIVFIEVKARGDEIDDILCTSKQQDRIRRSAEVFVQRNRKYHGFDMRFDLVVVRPYQWPQIIQNAW